MKTYITLAALFDAICVYFCATGPNPQFAFPLACVCLAGFGVVGLMLLAGWRHDG